MEKLLDFLNEIQQRKIHYTLRHNRPEAVMVLVAVPGERWEIEFFADDHVEIEVFKSQGGITGEESIKRLFAEFSD